MKNEVVLALKDFLKSPRKIVITMHSNADGDALGSSLGLYHFFKNLGQEVQVIAPDEYADFIKWMEGNEQVIIYENQQELADEKLNNADLLCYLDFSGYSRVKKMEESVRKFQGKTMLVDHHLNPEITPDFNFWDNQAAATCELIFDLIVAYQGLDVINQAMSECLYAGIMTDTGSFKHPCTSSKIHRIVADLMDRGARVNAVSRKIYDNNTFRRLKFLGFVLSEKLVVDEQNKMAYITISEEENDRFSLKKGDTEGLVNYALSIKGINVATIMIQRDDEVKLSFRSVEEIAVNTFASEYFDGGGHKNAAGGISHLSLKETEKKFLDLVQKGVFNN